MCAIWDGDTLLYCGIAGREFERAAATARRRCGLITRLTSHASGRLSGDQFCVYVANRVVVPPLTSEQLARLRTAELTLEELTRRYINERLKYQFAIVQSSADAYVLERECRRGSTFGARPMLNPA